MSVCSCSLQCSKSSSPIAIAEDEAGVDRLPPQRLHLGNRIHPLHREFDAGMLVAKFTEAVEHDKTVVDPQQPVALLKSSRSTNQVTQRRRSLVR
jgi:hypothetical protein